MHASWFRIFVSEFNTANAFYNMFCDSYATGA